MKHRKTIDSSSGACRRMELQSGNGRLIALAALLCIAISPIVSGEDGQELRDLKEEIKQEILQEIRDEGANKPRGTIDVEALKETIKQEILEELRKEREGFPQEKQQTRQEIKNEIKQEIIEAIREDKPTAHAQAVKDEQTALGDAKGQMLHRGQGLAGCQVKLVQFASARFSLRASKWGDEFLSITDSDGGFHFKAVPAGEYKLKWQLPGDTGWFRRLRDRPDVIIRSGQLSTIRGIETSTAPLPQ